MKLSARARYGVRLMLALARQYGQGPVFLRQVAEVEEISEKYLSQIIISLRGAGLVHSIRGAHGGYILSRPPGKITLREIVEPLEGGNYLVDCVQQASVCSRAAACAARDVWIKLGQKISKTLDAVTLKEMVQADKKKQINARGLHI